jgi:hypothetical protein
MSDAPHLPELVEGSHDLLFSVPCNLVSSEMSSNFSPDELLDSIPVTDAEGRTVSIAELHEGSYYFHLPSELAADADLGNVYFEFRLRADLHDSWTSRLDDVKETQAILMLPVFH